MTGAVLKPPMQCGFMVVLWEPRRETPSVELSYGESIALSSVPAIDRSFGLLAYRLPEQVPTRELSLRPDIGDVRRIGRQRAAAE